MSNPNLDFKKLVSIGILVLFFLSAIVYGYFKLKHVIDGPYLAEINIEGVGRVSEPYLQVQGIAKNIEAITLNGKPIMATLDGEFVEDIILAYGYNIVELELRDKIGKIRKYDFPIILDRTALDGESVETSVEETPEEVEEIPDENL